MVPIFKKKVLVFKTVPFYLNNSTSGHEDLLKVEQVAVMKNAIG